MRSIPETADLSTKARIRNAAIELFGAHGVEATTVRQIAAAANVSPALVVHHFGDKAGLRSACTAHIADLFVTGTDAETGVSPSVDAVRTALQDLDAYGPAIAYLGRILADGADGADEIFDALLARTRDELAALDSAGLLQSQRDPDMTALLLTVFGLAPVILGRQFARALGPSAAQGDDANGTTVLTSAALLRTTLPTLDLFTHGLYRDDQLLRATEAALGAAKASTATPADREESR